ncbi:alkyl/aryl-sulfatase [Tenacibaculum sp. SG-28]|uniref:alkyl/aryl-sulfatase n=1 Tax=Tenacibaculum sp. SG-28 TaxID=754426 RepID=UPI000CF46422|nr:alkyl sulfatase dimerization domain-containing protein [Tenacibaculum sp. SG-28]PQJ19592.1 hypothetical protein BSU00_12345 [Tenacibaculum sp. SG-28]
MRTQVIQVVYAIVCFSLLLNCTSNEKTEDSKETQQTKTNLEATKYTIAKQKEIQNYLNFNDSTDFKNAQKGFLATIADGVILKEDKTVSYSMEQFKFLNKDAPNTANPSLWRQSQLIAINGLFEVTEGIYQIRGFDLANMTLIKGKTGWIIIDPLTVPETVKAAMELVDKTLGKLPVKAVIFTHSHVDHFGGVKGLLSSEDVTSGKIEVLAPEGFFEHSISENVMAGNAMTRRATYMYGNLLPKTDTGSLGSGLGTTSAKGNTGIVKPSRIISASSKFSQMVDGIEIQFIYTPESEAPAEMMFYFPSYKAFCQSENLSHTLHNLYTLRGAQVRNGQKWSRYIDECIAAWGEEMIVSFGSHHWPTWGNENIIPYLEKQRDTYRFIHDQTLRLANQGYTPIELAKMIKLPENLNKEFYNRGYYGSVSHDVKAQYQLYFGWFDGNPANLDPHTPEDSGKRFVEMMGGEAVVLKKSKEYYDKGDYRWVAQCLNNLVFANPNNQEAKNLLADAYQQLGYQAESGPWRNFYLTGAKELRTPVKKINMGSTATPDMIKGMDTQLYFEYLGMRFKGYENADLKYNFNINLTDTNEKLALIVSNGSVMPRMGKHVAKNITATINMSRSDLNKVSLGEANFADLLKNKQIAIDGDAKAFTNLLSKIDAFEFWFNIVQP